MRGQPDLEKLSGKDILEVLNQPEIDDFDGDGDDIIDLAIKEAGRRLTAEPESFGETALVNLVKEANKMAERRDEKARREAEAAKKELDVLDVLNRSSLPPERKRELVEQEVARLRALIIELEEHLDG